MLIKMSSVLLLSLFVLSALSEESSNQAEPGVPEGESENHAEPHGESEPQAESGGSDTENEAQTESDAESETETESGGSDTENEAQTESDAESETETEPEGESEDENNAELEDETKTGSEGWQRLEEPDTDVWYPGPGNTGTWWRTPEKTTKTPPTVSPNRPSPSEELHDGELKRDDRENIGSTWLVVLVAVGFTCVVIVTVLVVVICKGSRSKTFDIRGTYLDEKWPEVVTKSLQDPIGPPPSYKCVQDSSPQYSHL